MNSVFQAPLSTAFLYRVFRTVQWLSRDKAKQGSEEASIARFWREEECPKGGGGGSVETGREGVESGLYPVRLTGKGECGQAKIEMFFMQF